MKTAETLAERGAKYGNFLQQSEISQDLFAVMLAKVPLPHTLKSDQLEALHMICVKLARITNGDPHYADSWRDIAGYATLVADRLEADHASHIS